MAWVEFCDGGDGGGDSWIHQYQGYAKSLEGYLGLMFQINGQTHYGWALLKVKIKKPKEEVFVTLLGYAYETVPGMPIDAGQTE